MVKRLFVAFAALGEPLRPARLVIPSLCRLARAGYSLVLLTEAGEPVAGMLSLFESQGIRFDAVLECPHEAGDDCLCRKPHLGRLRPYLTARDFDAGRSYVVGNEPRDAALAANAGLGALLVGETLGWERIAEQLVTAPRTAKVERVTRETRVRVEVNLDREGPAAISTGIGFYDHMLEQVSKHGGFELTVEVKGDLQVDEHHTVEDTALALGAALRQALGDKLGIARYGFVLPMDEAEARASLDLSGRPWLVFDGRFPREAVGGMPTELVPHFFRSLSESLGATLHLEVRGENAHHMVEASFKAVGRALRAAIARGEGGSLPSTKGSL